MLKALGLAALGILVCSSCAASDGGRAAAEFRYLARSTYSVAKQESCRPSSVVYAEALADEIAGLREFESTASEGVRFQLALARADVAHGAVGCWADDDPRFAERHLSMARDRLTHGLEAMPRFASALPESPPRDDLAAETSVEFRFRVKRLIEAVNPQCQLSEGRDDEAILAPSRAALDAFERRLDGTAYALHFDIAEADVLYEQSVTIVECVMPQRRRQEVIRAALEADVQSDIEAIESGLRTP